MGPRRVLSELSARTGLIAAPCPAASASRRRPSSHSARSASAVPPSPARPTTPRSHRAAARHSRARQREALSSEVAAKVKAAALDKVPGATVLRTESGGPYNSAYHAHIKTSDGTQKVVLVNASFEATAVQADQGRGGRGKAATAAAATARPR
jgi:hypothetical protein